MLNKFITTVFAIGMLASCKLGENYEQKDWQINDNFSQNFSAINSNQEVLINWWKVFNDPVLNKLIEEAAIKNHDIKIAKANIQQARIAHKISKSDLLPSLNGTADANRSRNISSGEQDNFQAGFDASWELDIWGKNQRQSESALAEVQATIADKQATTLSVIAETARNYFELRGTQKRLANLEKNIELLKEIEDLANSQLQTGIVTELDLARARGEREQTESQVPNLQADVELYKYRLAVLCGQLPEMYLKKLNDFRKMPKTPETIASGLRSDLLKRRPDVIAAERRLASKTADIGVKTAELFPSFSLNAALGTGARAFGDLFAGGSGTYTIGAGLDWAIFNGGENRAELENAKSEKYEEFLKYEQAVLSAIEDAEGSLISYDKEINTLQKLLESEKSRKEVFDISKFRYEAGEDDFLVILDAERSLIEIEDSVIQSKIRVLTKLTQSFKALGGGWQAFEEK